MRKPFSVLPFAIPSLPASLGGRSFIVRRFEDPEPARGANAGGQSGGNTSGGNQGNQAGNNPPDLAQALAGLLARNGGSMDTVGMMLLSENHGYRDRIRQLEGRLPEGSVVLAGDDLARWQAYQALGQPTDLQTAIAERDTFRTDLTTLQRTQAIADAAELAGYKAKVLGQLPKAASLTFTIKDETDNGQAVRRAYVKDGDTEELLTTYAEREWPDFLPSLSADTNPAQRAPGAPMVRQHVGGKAPASDPIATHSQKVGYALPGQRKD